VAGRATQIEKMFRKICESEREREVTNKRAVFLLQRISIMHISATVDKLSFVDLLQCNLLLCSLNYILVIKLTRCI
jgi:hypothetical protein